MLVPYKDGSDWMDELEYLEMVDARERDNKKKIKSVSFEENENFENEIGNENVKKD